MTKYPATRVVHTPSGPEPCCQKHAKKLSDLMAFMGAYTNSTDAPEWSECNNCRNESESKGVGE